MTTTVAEPPRLYTYWELARPFTLLMPALSVLSKGVIAWSVGDPERGPWSSSWTASTPTIVLDLLLGALVFAGLNAASNAYNQVHDLPIDRMNRPGRPLPTGRMEERQAIRFAALLYVLTIGASAFLGWQTFALVLGVAACTWLYSTPLVRAKAHWMSAGLVIALARGWALSVAGWAIVVSFDDPEPWYIGAMFFLYVLGASSAKDFSDTAGDRANDCMTLPVRFGSRRAAWMMAPLMTLPFLMLPLGAQLGLLSADPLRLGVLAAGLTAWGAWVVRLLLLHAEERSERYTNHPAWTHMYFMMVALQIGLALAYAL